jgi:hypothetical protein
LKQAYTLRPVLAESSASERNRKKLRNSIVTFTVRTWQP